MVQINIANYAKMALPPSTYNKPDIVLWAMAT